MFCLEGKPLCKYKLAYPAVHAALVLIYLHILYITGMQWRSAADWRVQKVMRAFWFLGSMGIKPRCSICVSDAAIVTEIEINFVVLSCFHACHSKRMRLGFEAPGTCSGVRPNHALRMCMLCEAGQQSRPTCWVANRRLIRLGVCRNGSRSSTSWNLNCSYRMMMVRLCTDPLIRYVDSKLSLKMFA